MHFRVPVIIHSCPSGDYPPALQNRACNRQSNSNAAHLVDVKHNRLLVQEVAFGELDIGYLGYETISLANESSPSRTLVS